jgi:hypothetical protein
VRGFCGYDQHRYETSCYHRPSRRVVINNARWTRGALAYQNSLPTYRYYLINHEVGHALGHHHTQCPTAGTPAPVMMQQTIGLTNAEITSPANPTPGRPPTPQPSSPDRHQPIPSRHLTRQPWRPGCGAR